MAHCEHIETCSFFKDRMIRMPENAEFMKGLICLARPERCERMKRAPGIPVHDRKNTITPLGTYAS
jgi:hypothetical protein